MQTNICNNQTGDSKSSTAKSARHLKAALPRAAHAAACDGGGSGTDCSARAKGADTMKMNRVTLSRLQPQPRRRSAREYCERKREDEEVRAPSTRHKTEKKMEAEGRLSGLTVPVVGVPVVRGDLAKLSSASDAQAERCDG